LEEVETGELDETTEDPKRLRDERKAGEDVLYHIGVSWDLILACDRILG